MKVKKRFKKGYEKVRISENKWYFCTRNHAQVHSNIVKQIGKKLLKKSLKKIWIVKDKDSIFATRKRAATASLRRIRRFASESGKTKKFL